MFVEKMNGNYKKILLMEKIGVIIFDVNFVEAGVCLLWHCTWVIYNVS